MREILAWSCGKADRESQVERHWDQRRPRPQDIDRHIGARVRERRVMLGLAQQQRPAGGPGRARDRPGWRPGDRRRRDPRGWGPAAKVRIEPMHRQALPMHLSLRCGARTRRGSRCRSPAVKGRARCRMHGGATGSGAQAGNRNALKHARYTARAARVQAHASASCCARVRRSSSWPRRADLEEQGRGPRHGGRPSRRRCPTWRSWMSRTTRQHRTAAAAATRRWRRRQANGIRLVTVEAERDPARPAGGGAAGAGGGNRGSRASWRGAQSVSSTREQVFRGAS